MFLVPGDVGGTEVLTIELINELGRSRPSDEFFVYCGSEAAEKFPDSRWPSNITVKESKVPCRLRPLRLAYELLWLPFRTFRDRIDLLHSLGATTPLWSRGVRVVSIHDLIFHHFPDTFSPAARRVLDWLVPAGARRSRRVIALSNFSKTDLVQTYELDESKIDVAYPGCGAERSPGAAAIELPWDLRNKQTVLCVASGHRHKNLETLFRAFSGVHPDAELVVVGRNGLQSGELTELVAELGLNDRVVFTGWIERELLEATYAAERLFVYPTLREGFGLPVLEAMQRGVPVACSSTSSLPEAAGDAAMLFDPKDVDSIADAINRLIEDEALCTELIQRGRARAEEFTWRESAEKTWSVYERAFA